MPLLAFIRKDTGWRIDWQIRRLLAFWRADPASHTRKRFHCGGIVAGPRVNPARLTQTWSRLRYIAS